MRTIAVIVLIGAFLVNTCRASSVLCTDLPSDISIQGEKVPKELIESIVRRWVEGMKDKSLVRVLEKDFLELPVVKDLHKEGFIFQLPEVLQKRDGKWVDGMGRDCVVFKLAEVRVEKDTFIAVIQSTWGNGFQIDQYTVQKNAGKWRVEKVVTTAVS